MSFVVAATVLFLFVYALARSRQLFVVSVRNGRVLLVRGRISSSLLADIQSVVAVPKVPRGTVTAIAGARTATLSASGLDERQAQKLRNILALWPVARLRSAPRPAHRTLGQHLGMEWLAWLSARREARHEARGASHGRKTSGGNESSSSIC